MSDIVIRGSFIEDEVLAVLIDRIVCEMHVQVLKIALDRRLVRLSCKAS